MDVVLFVFIFNKQRVEEIKGGMGKKRNVSWQCRIKTGFELFPYKKTLHLQPLALANLIPWRVYTPNNTLKAQCSDPKRARTLFRSKLKTEEGYSADIYTWRYMSTLCLTRDICLFHISFVRCCADLVRTLCGHISPGIYVRTIFFFGFQLRLWSKLCGFWKLDNNLNCVFAWPTLYFQFSELQKNDNI